MDLIESLCAPMRSFVTRAEFHQDPTQEVADDSYSVAFRANCICAPLRGKNPPATDRAEIGARGLSRSITALLPAIERVLQFSEEFTDEGVSGAVPPAKRPGFARLLAYARRGDVIHVYAVDRLGRDALDVQATVRTLLEKGVAVEVHGLGRIARGVGELILAVLAQGADMERLRIKERTEAGRAKARAALIETGRTHKGKASMGRPKDHDPIVIAQWRLEHSASITATAEHFGGVRQPL